MLLIKKEFASKKVAFKKGFTAVGSKTQDELLELAILAIESNDKGLLKLFDKLPALDALKKMKTDRELGFVKGVAGKEKSEVKKEVPSMKEMVMTNPNNTKSKKDKIS